MGVRTGGGWAIGRGVGAAVGLLLLAGVAGCGASGASPTATTAQPDAAAERACRAIFERLPASARGDGEGGGDTARPPSDIQG
jgi:hypothetical protein